MTKQEWKIESFGWKFFSTCPMRLLPDYFKRNVPKPTRRDAFLKKALFVILLVEKGLHSVSMTGLALQESNN